MKRGWSWMIAAGIVLAGPAVPGRSQPATPEPSDAPFDVVEATIPELQAAMDAGRVTSRELVESYLARIAAYDVQGPGLNAFISLNPRAADEAAALDRERAEGGGRGPLHGIPIVLKDNFETADLPTTGSTLALAGFTTGADAFQVRRLREAGAVILGKTNLHELAAGITTVSSLGGQTLNPYDLGRNPGGSSGGTGTAVAASLAAAGFGSDTCGSIRIPASHNNLVGLRGTYGLSSRQGIIPLSTTQDIGGPLARTVMDLALLLDATVGRDPDDESTRLSEGRIPPSYAEALRAGTLDGAGIGVLSLLFGDAPEDEEVAQVVRSALDDMEQHGARIVEVAVPGLAELLRDSSVIDSEFKFDLMAYLDGVRAPVRSLADILDRGLYHEALDEQFRRRNAVERRETDQYRRARVKRTAIRQVVLAAMDEHEVTVLAYPTIRRKPALIGEPQRGSNCQLSASSGLPALSLPAGFTGDGLPVGLELLGREFAEAELLSLAHAFDQASPRRQAPFSAPGLVNGRAPAEVRFEATIAASGASARVRFGFDPTTSRLRYEVAVTGAAAADVAGVSMHRGREGEDGAVVAVLALPGRLQAAGELVLSAKTREALAADALHLRLHVTGDGLVEGRASLRLP